MTKLEEYERKGAASLPAVAAASNDRDRAFHRNAHSSWRKFIRGLGGTGVPAEPQVIAPALRTTAKRSTKAAAMKKVTLADR
jgi:hypothetical protein